MKKILLTVSPVLLATSLFTVPVLSHAADLHIANNSMVNLSFSINGACSAEWGVVKARTIGMISEANFNKSCEYSPSACLVNMYASDDCSNEKVGSVTLDTSAGVTGITANAEDFSISGNDFNIFVDGPWSEK